MSALPIMLRPSPDGDPPPDDVDAAPVPEPARLSAVVTLAGSEMSLADQTKGVMWVAWRNALRRARDLQEHEGGLVHQLHTGKPPSLAEECRYAQSRMWVPPGHEGGIAEVHGVIYHAVVGRPGVAVGNWISATAHKPMRFYFTLIFIVAFILIIVFA